MTDEWPPKRCRSFADWDAYWARQRWDRRWRHETLNPFLWRLRRKILRPAFWWRHARRFVQRGRRGWADGDTCSMSDYIARLLGEMTAELKRVQHGYPCLHFDRVRTCTCEQDWDATLDQISGPLLAYANHWDDDKMPWEPATETQRTEAAQAAIRLIADNLDKLWD